MRCVPGAAHKRATNKRSRPCSLNRHKCVEKAIQVHYFCIWTNFNKNTNIFCSLMRLPRASMWIFFCIGWNKNWMPLFLSFFSTKLPQHSTRYSGSFVSSFAIKIQNSNSNQQKNQGQARGVKLCAFIYIYYRRTKKAKNYECIFAIYLLF